MQKIFVFLVFLSTAVLAQAQEGCGDRPVAECEKQAGTLVETGKSLADQGDFAAAIENYDQALALIPEMESALSSRAYALYRDSRYEASLSDATRLVALDPEYRWYPYMRGLSLAKLGRQAEALAAFDRSVALDPEYFYSRYARAKELAAIGNFDAAEADLLRAIDIRPFSDIAFGKLGDLYLEQGRNMDAARAYRIALSINPNYRRVKYRLDDLVQLAPFAPLEPVPYAPPAAGFGIRYLEVLLPRVENDASDEVIGELLDWFRPAHEAEPLAKLVLTRRVAAVDGDTIDIALDIEARDVPEAYGFLVKGPKNILSYRGLVSSVIQPSGPRGPTFAIRYDEGSSPDIWPLEVGRSVSGTGRILLVCPEKTKLMAVAMGCSQGVETVELGALEYSIEVVGAEQVHVPLGVFDTLVIRYREKAYMEVFGRRKDRVVESKWWFSPELEFWVRRTGQQGDKVYIAEATDLLDE